MAACLLFTLAKPSIHQAILKRDRRKTIKIFEKVYSINLNRHNRPRKLRIMAKKFFGDDWECLQKDELLRSRARLSGFIEATTDRDKLIRDVSILKQNHVLF
jgi:hypothetical protein